MNKTRLFIILIILAAVFGAAWYFIIMRETPGPEVEVGNEDQNLFPFTSGSGNMPVITDDLTPEEIQEMIELDDSTPTEDKLAQIWAEPQAGAVFVPQASSTIVRFVDSATGHIYDALKGGAPVKISNVTIPQIKEALWGKDGKALVLRYLKEDGSLQSFAATVSTSSISTAISGTFLPANIKAIGVTDGKILYANPGRSSGNIYLANMSDNRRSEVYNSPFTDWSISFENLKTAFLYTRPTAFVSGSGFILDLSRSTLTKIAGNGDGLEGVMSPSGEHVFLSYMNGSQIESSVYSISKKTFTPVAPGTLAAKCAWSLVDSKTIYCGIPKSVPEGNYPDDWYKGLASFSDSLWSVNVETGETKLLLDPAIEGEMFDISKIVVGPKDEELAITNKSDLSLWIYDLE